MSQLRRHRRGGAKVVWSAIGATFVIHALLLGTVQALGISVVGHGFDAASPPGTPLVEPEVAASCTGDVFLATSARAAMCLAPWTSDVDGCGYDVMMSMWMDLSSCQQDEGMSTAPIALLSQKQADKVTPIDPERLIDEAKQEQLAQEKPTPPPPPVTPQNAPPPPPPPPPAPPRSTQVVETAKPSTEQAPDNARFVSEYDVKVEHQTVARGSVQEPMVAKSKPEELTAKKEPQEASVKELVEKDPGKNVKAPEVPGLLAMRAPGAPNPSVAPQEARTRGQLSGERGPLVADGFVPRHGDGAIQQQKLDPGELSRGQGGAGGGAPQVPNLKPTPEALERALGGGSVDHLEDVDSGDETALSSKRFVYASFFNRMKRMVRQNWSPDVVWRRSDPDGTVYGFKRRITEVRVSLSATGALAKIVVVTPSGITDLDDEAVRAFHASAPFPNPPDGLVGKDGLITFAFGFYFEVGAPQSSWRVIRSM